MQGDKVAIELANQVPYCLADLEFPAPKQDIVERAQAEGADPALIAALRALPDGTYASSSEVAGHIGGTPEDGPAAR